MEGLLAFLIIFVFVIVTFVVICGIYVQKLDSNETFRSNGPGKAGEVYSTSKFYTYPPSKWEKANSLYTPIICRPPEHSGLKYQKPCTNVLYPKSPSKFGKGEMASPCNPEIEAKYYAQRPILQAQTYLEMLTLLFKHITQRVPKDINTESLRFQDEFCNGECYSNVMKYIMQKINIAKNTMKIFKDYAKNDTWGGEQFAFLNERVYSYSNHDNSSLTEQERAKLARYGRLPGPKKLVVSFTLHNTLRSTSTDIIAIIYAKDEKYYIDYIDFATKPPTNKVKGQFINNKAGSSPGINLNNENIPNNDQGPVWIYGNTIQNNLFNLKGFYDSEHPENNILIPGGVPEEFRNVLDKCDQSYLMNPENAQARSEGGPLVSSGDATETNSPIFPLFPSPEMQWNVKV